METAFCSGFGPVVLESGGFNSKWLKKTPKDPQNWQQDQEAAGSNSCLDTNFPPVLIAKSWR